MSTASVDSLVEQLLQVVRDAERLLESGGHGGADDAAAMPDRDRISASITKAHEALARLQDELGSRAKAAVSETNQYVHDNVWTSIGVAGAVGVLLGWLLGRR